MLTSQTIRDNLPTWRRSFVDWSESEYGFYVQEYYDADRDEFRPHRDERGRPTWRPVQWQKAEREALGFLFTLDESGKLPYSKIYWVDIGKTAKTLKHAAIAQWAGMFHQTNGDVVFAANSQDQAADRCFSSFKSSITNNPYHTTFVAQMTQRGQQVVFKNGNKAAPVPVNAATQAGVKPVFIGVDEMWGYEGHTASAQIAELKPTPTFKMSFFLATSYPPFKNVAGPLNDVLDYYFDSNDHAKPGLLSPIEGLEHLPLWGDDEAGVAIWWNRDPSFYPWVSEDFLRKERLNPAMTPQHYQRIWEARRVSREESLTPADKWDACEDEELHAVFPMGDERNVPMVVAVDLGLKIDTSGLVARSFDPVTKRYTLRYHELWRPGIDSDIQDAGTLIELVKYKILTLHRHHKVLACYYDPRHAELMATELRRLGVNMVEFTQNNMRLDADTQYHIRIKNRDLQNYRASWDLREHVLSAVAQDHGDGAVRIRKDKTTSVIDLAVADSMACWGVTQHISDFTRMAKGTSQPSYQHRARPWARMYQRR